MTPEEIARDLIKRLLPGFIQDIETGWCEDIAAVIRDATTAERQRADQAGEEITRLKAEVVLLTMTRWDDADVQKSLAAKDRATDAWRQRAEAAEQALAAMTNALSPTAHMDPA